MLSFKEEKTVVREVPGAALTPLAFAQFADIV